MEFNHNSSSSSSSSPHESYKNISENSSDFAISHESLKEKPLTFARKDEYSELDHYKESIIQLFMQHKKKLSPERRRWIFSVKQDKDIYEVYVYIKAIGENTLTCDFNKHHQAELLDLENFKLFCKRCRDPPNKMIICDENKHYIICKVLEMIRKANSFVLDKNHYKLLNKQDEESLASVILLGKSIADGVKFDIPRCCVCKKKITFGAASGVVNECGHIACFMCCLDDISESCLICNSKIIPTGHDTGIDINEYRFYCHSTSLINPTIKHCLLNYPKKVYKMPCMHNVCEDHINDQLFCSVCGLEHKNDLKLNQNLMKILQLLNIKCLEHNQPATKFKYFDSIAICPMCTEKNSGSDNFRFNAHILRLDSLLNIKGLKNHKIDQFTMKAVLNHLRIPGQTLYKLVRNYQQIDYIHSYTGQQIYNRFTYCFPHKGSNNIWVLNNNEIAGFNFSVSKKVLLRGILLGTPIRRNSFGELLTTICKNLEIKIYVIKNNIMKVKFELKKRMFFSSKNLNEENLLDNNFYQEIEFVKFVELDKNKNYCLAVKGEGTFFHGRPYGRIISDMFTISKLKSSEFPRMIEKGDHVVGGFIFGFLYSEFVLNDLRNL
ncbi:hypothetical protein SteCoe_3958 [Stentor coeruleus]|uniref:RING-type domain-containing protein n=1 Tax=Stentor coeruleus TaxID=5963 RepID=A0A1R2CVX2_9CILI|nr:hypothetical protein SteCoe_3958 [Stentor coeruleus]